MRILLVVYDNDSYIPIFPQGLAYIASVMRKAGVDVCIYNQDIYHFPEEHLLELLSREHFDAVGVSVIGGYFQYRKLLKISAAINNAKKRPFYILGGHGPAPEPEFFLRKTKADVIVIGEGESTATELIEHISGQRKLDSIDGIAFIKDGGLIKTPKRNLIKEIDDIPFPAWDLFPMDQYSLIRAPKIKNSERCLPVLSGRGCPYKCNFCYRMDEGFRARSPESLIEEISLLKRDYHIGYIDFSDELLMSSISRTEKLCRAFIKAKLNVHWSCSGRLNFARLDILKLMKEAGCVFINYGIESLDENALIVMKKKLTVRQINEGIQNTLASGISPGLNVIFGNIGETAESLKLGVDFLLKYSDHSQLRTIRPVTPYPGSELYYYAIENGLLRDCEDFYENKHVNSDLLSVNFTDMSDDEFHRSLFEANSLLIENYYEAQMKKTLGNAKKLYLDMDASFRGFRQT